MKSDYNDTSMLRTAEGAPDIKCMIAELDRSVRQASSQILKMERDANTRNAKWVDQSDSGRKPKLVGGVEADPWPNASDVRIRLADQFVNDDVKLCKATARRGKIRVKGMRSGNYANAGKVKLYLDYVRDVELRHEWRRQGTLAAQWRSTFGHSISLVDWLQETAIAHDEVTAEQLQAIATDPELAAAPLAQIGRLLFVPEERKTVVRLLRAMYPDLDQGEAWKRINELMQTGRTTLPRRYTRVNRPRRKALKPWRDIFYPLNTSDLQAAPWVAWRVLLTPAQVQEKAISDGWSEDFVAALLPTVGKTRLDAQTAAQDRQRSEVVQDSVEEMEGLIEVFYFFHVVSNEAGVPCRYRTVMSPHITIAEGEEMPTGPDEPLSYEHGLYPLVEHRREDNDDLLVDNRSVPELVLTHQQEIKWQRDGRINQIDLALQPPIVRPERDIGLKLTFRPRGEIGRSKNSPYEFGEVPAYQPGSVELERQVREDAERYFARNAEENAKNPGRVKLYTDDAVDDWAAEEERCWNMVLQMAQQFVDTVEFERVVGQTRTPIRISREEIQGQFDITVKFDAAPLLDPEAIESRLRQLNELVAMDRGGVINLAVVVRELFALMFPDLSDEALDDIETAGLREIEETDTEWAKMLAGVPPILREKGVNFSMRKMRLDQILADPINQQRAAAAPDTLKYVEEYRQHLTFMVDQQPNGANAQAGRVGVRQQGNVPVAPAA